MTLAECDQVREEAHRRFEAIESDLYRQCTVDQAKLKSLRQFCLSLRPRMQGRFGNVGEQFMRLATAAEDLCRGRRHDLSGLNAALSRIDVALLTFFKMVVGRSEGEARPFSGPIRCGLRQRISLADQRLIIARTVGLGTDIVERF
jgi:hypothetical protein